MTVQWLTCIICSDVFRLLVMFVNGNRLVVAKPSPLWLQRHLRTQALPERNSLNIPDSPASAAQCCNRWTIPSLSFQHFKATSNRRNIDRVARPAVKVNPSQNLTCNAQTWPYSDPPSAVCLVSHGPGGERGGGYWEVIPSASPPGKPKYYDRSS